MSNVIIMTDNFIDPSVVSTASVSSEQTPFPAVNVYNAQRRSKVWRSNGYWEITTSNNTIVFEETVGVELTAVLTPGEYNSDALLFTEIKSQMEAVGGSNYTVSRDTSTSKIKITSDGVGGAGIFKIDWNLSTASSTLGFDETSTDSGALTYVADVLKIGSYEWFKWDMGISSNPNAFILIGKKTEPIAITPSAVLTLQGNETDTWTNPSYSKTLGYSDSAISVLSDNGLHSEPLRYWRLKLEDSSNPQGFIEIGSLFLGDFFKPVRGAVQFPFAGKYVDRSNTVFSEGGQSFSDIREKTEQFELNWFGLTVLEKEEIDQHFENYGVSIPFFVCFDKDEVFSSDANYYIRYVKFSDDPSYKLTSPGVFECSMSLREEL
jgi:hypothetical protein